MTLDELLLAVMELADAERGLIVDPLLNVIGAVDFHQSELDHLQTDDPYHTLRNALVDGWQKNVPLCVYNSDYHRMPPGVVSTLSFRRIVMFPLINSRLLLFCDHMVMRSTKTCDDILAHITAFVRESEPNLVRRTM
jgi:hypothetical protein